MKQIFKIILALFISIPISIFIFGITTTLIFVGIFFIAYFFSRSKIYKSSKAISKADLKLTKFHKAIGGDASMVLFCFGILLFICIPILYLLDINDLIPLALISGILCFIIVVILRFLIKNETNN